MSGLPGVRALGFQDFRIRGFQELKIKGDIGPFSLKQKTSAVSQLLKNQLKLSEKERMLLGYFLGELTDNINEHSFAATRAETRGGNKARNCCLNKIQLLVLKSLLHRSP
jgi:hypothetical protein